MTSKLRISLFMLIFTCCVIVAVGYVTYRAHQLDVAASKSQTERHSPPLDQTLASARKASDDALPLPPENANRTPVTLPPAPFVLFRNTELGTNYGQLAAQPLDKLSGPRDPSGLRCERSYFAGGYGVCLTAERGSVTSYQAYIFDDSLRLRHRLPLQGIPSRTRVSPDGRYAAITVFVSGDSYSPGTFSTRTTVFRTHDGSQVGELEQFTIDRDGKPFHEIDFNFWGVTFAADGDHFYATLATGGRNYLIEGNLASQHARVIHSGVECPSVAPSGQRIAFKRLTKSGWHIYVLDLISGKETPLAEKRSVDDQVEWLDNDRILYAFDDDIWVASADGSGTPAIFLADAYSPAVVR